MLIRTLLVIEDETLRRRVRTALETSQAVLAESAAGERFWAGLGEETYDLVLATRSTLPEPLEISVSEVRNLPDRPDVIVLSDEEDLGERTRLLAAGALAVIPRSLSPARLRETLAALVERKRFASIDHIKSEREREEPRLTAFASASQAMRELLALAEKVATADTSLLILGETGVGKEWLGRAIHASGARKHEPFIAVNPAALPEQLLESELFGHEKGAFTGATKARRGAFELAHSGTLFLDEIGDMPPHLQIKLLRVLQERKIQRLGSESELEIDVRLMAATNQDLDLAMAEKRFRPDLYYRLSVMALTVPPLRRRHEDIPSLVETYIDQFRTQLGKPLIAGTSIEALKALKSYSWPGNVRELINVVERAVLLCEGELITLEELPEGVSGAISVDTGASHLAPATGRAADWQDKTLAAARESIIADFERTYLVSLLEETRGHVGETAERAGIDPRTLYNKMKLYGLRKEAFRGS
ncbi:MAG: sigma-54 dependent transcriptional regulator [Acidobacteriota bacterium]|nr:sigma-54 dependent transcriptional regulator [Acidobacteriota bacterium]